MGGVKVAKDQQGKQNSMCAAMNSVSSKIGWAPEILTVKLWPDIFAWHGRALHVWVNMWGTTRMPNRISIWNNRLREIFYSGHRHHDSIRTIPRIPVTDSQPLEIKGLSGTPKTPSA